MLNPDVKKAKTHLLKLRQLASQKRTPHFNEMREEEVIKAIRKTREELWSKKLAIRA